MATVSGNASAEAPAWQKLAAHWRVIITLALVLHLTAIISAPWAGPEPSGPLAQALVQPFRGYLNATYSDHGYRFFAPAPGPGHLVRYKLTFADGTTREDEFPNRQSEWPRLFYHRHFMLSEKLNGLFDSEEPGPEVPPEARREWQNMRSVFEGTAHSYAMHLLHETGAKQIDLQLVRHHIPSLDQVRQGIKLTHPNSYQVLWKHSYQAESS
jgi:hypothetical protein